ncbi:nuclear transport factor 2 family protein [Devosia rhodophyticola]|uniref:Nuclear transport factor 2 family protein n=1 Tax=Devosia rhodophyticola TaxID=3026423 RepID=A0ABY7YVR7_9HYPH|nr:nuclear transport factor 2 family protein [Devosia rhodophyticola]WDR05341.1 nuclear transport factor 2 family protein [Devosia rhodophyticola]
MNYQELWEMEKSFWLDGPDFYKSSMAPNARMVFPAPVGILAGQEIVEGLRQSPRWMSVDFHKKTETELGDTAVLAYEASGKRDGEGAYIAFCASTYVRKDGAWVLLAHQQTPKA